MVGDLDELAREGKILPAGRDSSAPQLACPLPRHRHVQWLRHPKASFLAYRTQHQRAVSRKTSIMGFKGSREDGPNGNHPYNLFGAYLF